MIALPGWRGGGTPILSYIQTNFGGSKFCISLYFLFFIKKYLFYLFFWGGGMKKLWIFGGVITLLSKEYIRILASSITRLFLGSFLLYLQCHV